MTFKSNIKVSTATPASAIAWRDFPISFHQGGWCGGDNPCFKVGDLEIFMPDEDWDTFNVIMPDGTPMTYPTFENAARAAFDFERARVPEGFVVRRREDDEQVDSGSGEWVVEELAGACEAVVSLSEGIRRAVSVAHAQESAAAELEEIRHSREQIGEMIREMGRLAWRINEAIEQAPPIVNDSLPENWPLPCSADEFAAECADVAEKLTA